MNNTNIILSTLATKENFFKLVDLSKKIDIDLKKYLHLCPKIIINYDDRNSFYNNFDKENHYNYNVISNLTEFKIDGSEEIFIDPVVFLQNVEKVNYIRFNLYTGYCENYVNNGELYSFDYNHRSIEFKYHNTSGYAYNIQTNLQQSFFYAINEKIISDKIFEKNLRELKLKKIINE